MSNRKSSIGNNSAFRKAFINPLREIRKPRKPADDDAFLYMKKDGKVAIIIDEKGIRFVNDDVLRKPKDFRIEEHYQNVVFFIKKGINISPSELNKIFLKAARR